jgi:hypothetical protein
MSPFIAVRMSASTVTLPFVKSLYTEPAGIDPLSVEAYDSRCCNSKGGEYMKRISALAAALILTLIGAQSAAAQTSAEIAGKWMLTVETPQGSQNIEMNLKVDGGKITGTIQGPQGEQEVSGTAEGSTVKLTSTLDFGGNQLSINYSATIDNDTMKGSIGFGGGGIPAGEIPFTGKRAK